MDRKWTKLFALSLLTCLALASGCDGKELKDPESCKTEGKESGEKCQSCCEASGKAGHRWFSGDCKCI